MAINQQQAFVIVCTSVGIGGREGIGNGGPYPLDFHT